MGSLHFWHWRPWPQQGLKRDKRKYVLLQHHFHVKIIVLLLRLSALSLSIDKHKYVLLQHHFHVKITALLLRLSALSLSIERSRHNCPFTYDILKLQTWIMSTN